MPPREIQDSPGLIRWVARQLLGRHAERDVYPNRPLVRHPLEPLTIPELYRHTNLQLNFRMPIHQHWPFALVFMGYTVAGVLGLLVLRVVSLCIENDFFWALLALAAVVLSLRFSFESWRTVLGLPVLALVFWLGVLLVKHFSFGLAAIVLTFFSVFVACLFADQVATNYAAWLLANPRLSRTSLNKWAQVWVGRFTGSAVLPPYSVGFFLVAGVSLGALVLSALFAGDRFAGMYFVTALVVLLVLLAIGTVLFNSDPRYAFAIAKDALNNWFSYNLHNRAIPGLYQSPFGRRELRAVLVLGLFVLSLLPLASYFPLYMAFRQDTPWLHVAGLDWPWEKLFDRKEPQVERLGKAEREMIDRLASHDPGLAERYKKGLLEYGEMPQAYSRLFETPESWTLVAVRGIFTGDARFAWALLWALLPCVVFPSLALFSVYFAIVGRTLPAFARCLEAAEQPEGTEFDHYVRRLLESDYTFVDGARERDHLWLGIDNAFGRPILIHRDQLNAHAHILGSTQAGKTSLALAPMLTQMIRALDPKSPHFNEQSSILVLDLKGEPALFHNVRLECERRGVLFKFFSTRYPDASYAFNPFEQTHLADISPEQRVDMLARALGIFYGLNYPEVYWSDMNAQVFRTFLLGYPDIRSFSRFSYYASEQKHYRAVGGHVDDWKKASHVRAAAQRLANVVPLNITAAETPSAGIFENRIDMKPLGSTRFPPQVLYFFISSTDDEATGHTIGKLALYSLLTAVNSIPNHEKRRTYVFCDEFQAIALDVLAKLFEQAAGLKVSYVLSNQSLFTLPEHICEVLFENTAFRQIFRAGSPKTRDFIKQRSGEALYDLYKYSQKDSAGIGPHKRVGSESHEYSEQIGPYYRDAEITATSYDAHASWVEMSSGKGYSRYGGDLFTIRTDYHITSDEYQKRERLPWPKPGPATLVAKDHQDLLSHYRRVPGSPFSPPGPSWAQDGVPAAARPAPIRQPLLPGIAPREKATDHPSRPIQPHPEFEAFVARFDEASASLHRAVETGQARKQVSSQGDST